MVISFASGNINTTAGPLLLGDLGAAVLYGITCVQAYIYYRKNYKDPGAFKLLILFMWFLDTTQLAFMTHSTYFYLVSNFNNPFKFNSGPPLWCMFVNGYVTIIIDTLIRCIFGRRVWLISRCNICLVSCIVATTCLAAVFGLVFTTKAFAMGTLEHLPGISYLVYLSSGIGVIADILITASLCIELSKRRTGHKRTESAINMMMMYSINTCLLTTVCSAATFMAYAIWPDTLIFEGIFYLYSKLYFCSLLATLNSREALLEKLGDHVISDPTDQVRDTKNRLSDPIFEPIVISVSGEVQLDVVGADASGKRNLDPSPLSSSTTME